MGEKEKKRRGAPKGNKNAIKHGFYSRVLDEAEKLDFEAASGVDGIDEEITLLRVEIKKALASGDDKALRILVKATNSLERMIRTRYKITAQQQTGLKEAITNVLRDVALPLGVSLGSRMIGK